MKPNNQIITQLFTRLISYYSLFYYLLIVTSCSIIIVCMLLFIYSMLPLTVFSQFCGVFLLCVKMCVCAAGLEF